ncbi:taperin [Takifugu flavidus]|uniref:taperin n=1 Tax=Takifugu flavidus TaxID=433684 RepID=UPI00254410FA|nr:taperin [Takifugu flavidus]
MSGGGEVRVLLQEAGQESSRMPAWKREILERRKAKSGVCGGASASETTAVGASPQRTNGDLWGGMNGSSGGTKSDSGASGGGPGRNYNITTANQYFINNKEPRSPVTGRTVSREGGRQESLVLHESLGPLEENPFIKLEKERRRRQDRENSARPVPHILELYGSVPGIRTIRAENIIIIESDPDYFPEDKSSSHWQENSVSSYSSLNDLLDRRGSAVTEIRAREVVIYDTTLSKSEENLSTLGRPDHEASSYKTGEGQGRVSRMLQKFDTNYGKLQKKSHSTENLLDLDCSSSSRPRLWPKPQPDLVPKPRQSSLVSSPDRSQLSSPVFYSPLSSKSKPHSAASEVSSPKRHFGTPPPAPSSRQWCEETRGCATSVTSKDEPDWSQIKPTREREWEDAEVPPKPKVPCSPETLRARAESPSSPVSAKVSQSSADFEIRPSPKPDITQIPDGDTQARALANLRLQSRNSFTVIPKRRPASPESGSPAPSSPAKSSPLHRGTEVPTSGVPTSPVPVPMLNHVTENEETLEDAKEARTPTRQSKPKPSSFAASSNVSPLPSEPLSPPAAPSSPSVTSDSPTPPSSLCSPSQTPHHPPVDHLPVTNIDDIEVESQHHVPAPSPMVQKRKGNTFTVVPKRRGEPVAQPGSPEPQQENGSKAPHGSTPPQAPYAHLGSTLKKRYPAVEEIEVIGGYLSLAKSCLSRTGSMGKKLKISFNETSLQSTYEYPSENSVWDSGGEEEEEEEEEEEGQEEVASEQPSMVGRIHIPRPNIIASSAMHSSNSKDLSSYVPKHSVDFNTWQEHKHNNSVNQEDSSAQQTQMTEEVMLTPADSSSLSDYSSEPALYF